MGKINGQKEKKHIHIYDPTTWWKEGSSGPGMQRQQRDMMVERRIRTSSRNNAVRVLGRRRP